MLVAAGLALGGCAMVQGGHGGTESGGGRHLIWLMTPAVLRAMSVDPRALATLQGGVVEEVVQPATATATAAGAPGAHELVHFTALEQLERWLGSAEGRTGRMSVAVLYDPESWGRTPASEQARPAHSIALAGAAAARAHIRLYVSPGLDLVSRLRPGTPRSAAYLALGLAAAAARAGAVVVVQAQSLEHDPKRYAAFVRSAAADARSVRRGATVLTGLSTNPSGPPVTLPELQRDVTATMGVTQGYWLNVPGRGAACPGCGLPRPDLGRELLDWIGR